MAGKDEQYKDPFADFDDGFGQNLQDDDLLGDLGSEFSSSGQKQYFGESELPIDGGFDQYGEPIIHESENAMTDDDQDDGGQSVYGTDSGAQPFVPSPVQPKPFLKTPVGMAAAGASLLMLCAVGAMTVSTLNGSDQTLPALAEKSNDQPVPRAGDPGFNDRTIPTSISTAVMVETKPVIKPVVTQVAPLGTQELTPSANILQAQASIDEPGRMQENSGAGAVDEVSRLKTALNRQREETEDLKTAIASLNQGIAKMSAYAEKDHAEQMLLKEQVDNLHKRLSEAPVAVSEASTVKAAPKAPAKVSTSAASDAPKEDVKKSAASIQNSLAEGRYRLPGVKVIEATESGKMAVISKTSNGRVYTLFKGEKLGTPRGNLQVTEIKEDGFLIFVGDKYYIDRVAEEKPVAVPVSASSSPARSTAPGKNTNSKSSSSSRVKDKAESSAPVQSSSYTLNAVYDGGNSFGIVNDQGEFKSYKMGDDVPGAGRISGLDANGDLKAGDKIIKSLY